VTLNWRSFQPFETKFRRLFSVQEVICWWFKKKKYYHCAVPFPVTCHLQGLQQGRTSFGHYKFNSVQ